MVVRLFIWSLFETHRTIAELRATLPELEEPSAWLWNEASERFGLVAFGDETPAELVEAQELVGRDPDVYEEFDVLDL